ncbi:MAG: hypothetical protein K0U84_06105 [Actinomycetia bacterium]|nr:hypothetical protein [Actinomycetes bacterium]
MPKLTIVVNCTDRKSMQPAANLRLGSLPRGDNQARFEVWRRRVDQADAQVRLVDLYQGEAWQEVRGLSNDARHAGYSVTTLVASAGLGLRDVSTLASPYAATFAGGHPDSVASSAEDNRDWWRRLSGLKFAQSLTDSADRVLLVLSETYARSLEHDLIALADRGGDLLLVGGARDIDGLPRLPANRSLRAELGGTTSSVSLRMARRWLRCRTSTALHTARDASAWSDWAQSVARSEIYHRAPMTDAEIGQCINKLCADEPNLSATRALRRVRDAGIACEQKRFGRIFHSVMDPR